METYVELKQEDFEHLLKKGYEQHTNGNEYVYSFRIPNTPIMMKIMSSIKVDTGKGRNKGADAIRVFAVKVGKEGKVLGGYIRAKRVYRTTNWKENVRKAYINIKIQALKRAKKEGLI